MIYQNKYRCFHYIYLVRILLIFITGTVSAQIYKEPYPDDTLKLKEGTTIYLNDQKIKIKSDTIIVIPYGVSYKIIQSKDELFYNRLENRASNNFWTRELHNIIISDKKNITTKDTLRTIPSSQPFVPYHKKIIRNIILKQLPVFGPTISDTLSKPVTFFERTANQLHFQTRKFLIRKNLLFTENEEVNPDVLADNERLLRALPYIDDSKIEVLPANKESDSVDIVVIVKDNWSMAFDLKIEKLATGKLDIFNKNILGLGQEVRNSALWDKRKRPGTGYEGSYIIHNIGGSFFKGNFTYNKSFGDQSISLNLNRDFFTPNIKYAGGFLFKNVQTDVRYYTNVSADFTPVEYNHYELWTGRSFLLTGINTNRTRQNITFAGKALMERFYKRPKISETSYYYLQNKTLLLLSAIYTQQNFFESNLIYNFGRTEDIPVGLEVGITGGYEINEFFNRQFISGKFASGKFIGPYGYISAGLSVGSFFNNKTSEQGIITSNVNYFSNLFVLNKFHFRQFLTINHTQGHNRFVREYLTMNNELGISGFRNDSVYGNQRINMKWETVCFTPWKFYDFKFVIFVFADHTWLSKQNQSILYGAPYTGFGFGIRLRNERLVFNTLQLRITFYPKIPPESITHLIKISGEPLYNPYNFAPKAPDLIEFK